MNYKNCGTCHWQYQGSGGWCNDCNHQPPSKRWDNYDEIKANRHDKWEPDDNSIALIAFGRRAGIEEAAKALESNLNVPGTSLQTRLTPWVDQGDCIRASVRQVRALLEAKT